MKIIRSKLFRISIIAIIIIYSYHIYYVHKTTKEVQVRGWEKGTSRYVGRYINEELEPHILPDDFCANPVDIVAFVFSKPNNLLDRQFIRKTWGKRSDRWMVYYLLGETEDAFMNEVIRVESSKYQDVIQERFVDTYNNLTLKSIIMLKLFKTYCRHTVKYLVKLDDDLIVNVRPLVKRLLIKKVTSDLLLGNVAHGTRPFRKWTNKWYIPRYLYPWDILPDYLRGPSYAMTSDVASNLYEASWLVPIIHIEDFYVTGLCARKIGQNLTHDPYMSRCFKILVRKCDRSRAYTIHEVGTIENRFKLWDQLQRPSKC